MVFAAIKATDFSSKSILQVFSTRKRLYVKVPVLSVAIVVTAPIVSIDRIVCTKAFLAAIRRIPNTKITDIATGKLSGIAETVIAKTNLVASIISIPRTRASPKATIDTAKTTVIILLSKLSIFFWIGLTSSSFFTSDAIAPNSVLLPVAVTAKTAFPLTTKEPW